MPTIVVGIQSFWLEMMAMLLDNSFSGNTSGVGIRSKIEIQFRVVLFIYNRKYTLSRK